MTTIYKIIIIIIFVLSSCTPIAFMIYGVKKPKPVCIKYISKKADNYKLTHFKHYVFENKFSFLDFFQNTQKFGLGTSVNQVLIFNKQGFLYLPKDSINCSSQIINYIVQYKNRSIVIDSLIFDSIFPNSFIQMNENEKKFVFPTKTNKDLFVLTWASFSGRLNKDKTKYWADSIAEIIDSNEINAVFLNLDIQENWK